MTPLTALPALIGVILGIAVSIRGLGWPLLVPAALIVVPWVLVRIGKARMAKQPMLAWGLIEPWILAAIGMTALSTACVVYLGAVLLPNLLGQAIPVDEEPGKTLLSTFVGAVTAYAAIFGTKDTNEGKGYFWPSTQFKEAVWRAAGELRAAGRAPPVGSVAGNAMLIDAVQGQGISDWSFSARYKRAGIVRDFISGKMPNGNYP